MTKMEDDKNGRRPIWKTTNMEDYQYGRRPKWKTTKNKDNLKNEDDVKKEYNFETEDILKI